MVIRVKLFYWITFIFLCIPCVQLPVRADTELPAVIVALSDDQSIIIERVLYEGLKRSGYQMIAKTTGMRTAIADVNFGDAAILPVQTDGWERIYPNLVKIPVVIDNVEFSTYTRSDSSFQFSEWQDMAGLRLGYRWQNEYIVNNIRQANAGGLVTVNEIDELWELLQNGEADAVILPHMSHFEHRMPPGVRRAGIIERQPVYTYINNKFHHLALLLENAYTEMIADGTMDLIFKNRSNLVPDNRAVVMHINSYNAQNDWERNQMDFIRINLEKKISEAGINSLEYYSFYLNSNELHSQANFNTIVKNMIRTRLITRVPDIVIVSGNEALDLTLNNYYLLFPRIPVLFYGVQGVNNFMLHDLEEYLSGVFKTISFSETVSLMLDLHPDIRRIFILNDNSLSGSKAIHDEIQTSIDSFKQNFNGFPVEFEFNGDKPFPEILEEIKGFGSDTLVLVGNYLCDSEGFYYSEKDVQRLVSGASINPVFCLFASYIGNGIFGGLVSGGDIYKNAVISMASDIIRGLPPSQIPVVFDSSSLNQWQFDYSTAGKFNIKIKNLPPAHTIVNRNLPLWESNPIETQMILTLIMLIIFIFFGLMMFIRMRTRKQADENMHLLLDAVPVCCQLWDRNYNTIDCNKAGVELYGFKDKKEYIDRFFRRCMPEMQPDGQHSDTKARFIVNKAFEEGYYKAEFMYCNLKGDLIPAEVTLIRVKHHKEGFLVAGYTRDLRAHKKYVAEIEKAQNDMRHALDAEEAANKTKSIFLANMSHEIRTPMNSIVGFAELAHYSKNPDKINEYLDNILKSAEGLLKVINDILDISKIESGKISLENIPFDLHEVLSFCRMTIKPKTEEKGISLYCYAEPSINKKILGDPVRLRQVLLNLLSNAVKFTKSGTVKLLASIADSNSKSVTIHFEVKDSGIGMTKEQLQKIFEPFMQADNSVTRRFGGTGLGLPIAKNIIELMGGAISADSIPEVGSRFSFNIKFELDEDNYSGEENFKDNLPDVHEKPDFSGEILICEDNGMNQQVICEHLARVGLETVVANNGREGYEYVLERMQSGKKPFDLIFMDIHMPEMDGLEASEKITAMGVKTPIIALTANVMYNEVNLYKQSGICDFLAKPFTLQDLWKCLAKYLPVVSYSRITDSSNQEKSAFKEDEDFLKKIRINFTKSSSNIYSEIENAYNSGDLKLAHRIAHTLKSNAGQIGEKKLQETAAEIEEMLAKGSNPFQSGNMKTLNDELKQVLDKFTPLLAEIENARAAKITLEGYPDMQKIREILLKLETMLLNKNPECEDLIDDVMTIPETEELLKQIDSFNFKKASFELTKLKEKLGVF